MRLCVCCAVELPDDQLLCPHHHEGFLDAAWARWNRLVCDLLHRGIEPPRIDPLTVTAGVPAAEVVATARAMVCAAYADA